MPLYEYYCSQCKSTFEKRLPMSRSQGDEPCPECQKPSKRAISVFASFVSGGEATMSADRPSPSDMAGGMCGNGGCDACL
ncbi:MAG: zinc ribbon domain-containing protein [Chloroflexi bacterium]|nr:zinc ribbon domain-containing protein [Chloroflexota bacterium]